ncbi:MAG: translation initiation factor IF-3 [Acetomicrobium sp.]|uniref:translation initiation factor IF-3 n=1 Tax=Acetomicrobium TaxID=49894 RepID=UPI0026F2AF2F|nr:MULTISPECIES: translation initiation factor IF-3 [Acetomicrobium]MDR9770680.1 translation initiation factor IF-3 [Acetomicrobium sp.]HOB11118.1 translation initiation factor IF-3 [Acetomicrobium sp.]HQA36685.1 translation initiation factor IF-3 [Acetomicrobium sp.]HQC88753.1 translation initiation factor IF-3 [Acetomicrobium sp.]HXK99531.1 translation initiation factor IF-3 [Acetomicrobium sp.]
MAKANEPRVNEEIKVSEVLLIDADGTKVGVIPIEQALQIAESRGLDLVEVAPHANPPVCRVMDYGKYKYQQQKRDKEARKKQKTQTIKEIKMRPKIDEHDYNFKVKAIQRFLRDGHRVKVSVFFRGREMSFLDKGREVLERVARDCDGLGKVDSQPKMEGRYMRMMLVPVLQKSESKSSKD